MTAAEQQARLIATLYDEERRTREQQSVKTALSQSALEAKGQALRNMKLLSSGRGKATLQCSANYSKFREGDTVSLAFGASSVKARIRMIRDGGRLFDLACNPGKLGDTVTMLEYNDEIGAVFRMALAKLSPGTPGWWLLDVLAGSKRSDRLLRDNTGVPDDEMADQLCAEARLDADSMFKKAVAQCLTRPRFLAVRGPPGTGKTAVLSLVAEGLARKGLRVAVTAHTHQAVNNALSAIHQLFPARRICKLGTGIRRESLSADIAHSILKDEFGNGDTGILDTTIFGLTYASATIELSLKQSLFAPHVVLIDEAGQLPLPYAASMGLMGAGSYILFGDERQMPPVFQIPQGENPDAVSVFKRVNELHPQKIIQLAVSHRLNHQLCTAISRIFYEDVGLPGITSSHAAGNRTLEIGKPSADTPGSRALHHEKSLLWLESPAGDNRETNLWEAQRITEIIDAALIGGMTTAQLGVVVPFRRQVALIRKLLSGISSPDTPIPLVDTIERMQGITVDLVIVSATASEPGYISAIDDFLFSENRLNVAISRARCKAIIIGSEGLWQSIPTSLDGLNGQRVWHKIRDIGLTSA